MKSENARHLAYVEMQLAHPDPQLRPLMDALFGPARPRLQAKVEEEARDAQPPLRDDSTT